MMYPDTLPNKKINKCCKTSNNLEFDYGDGVEFEVYICKICNSKLFVNIEIVRDWESMEVAK